MSKSKKAGFLLLLTLILLTYYFLPTNLLTLNHLKAQQAQLDAYYEAYPLLVSGLYLLIYILSTAVSLPGATILTLAGGAIFGVWIGTILVSFASTIGATMAFLTARYFLKETIQNKFQDKLSTINQGIQKEGNFYLFTMRLIPIFPFFLINLVMGLTPIKTFSFFWVSQLGMLLGTLVYVNAGTQLAQIDSLSGILSWKLALSFALIGILPLISKRGLDFFKSQKHLRKFKKPRSFDYNMVVIGAGSAGLVSAYIASAVKAKVALIEKHKMGGDCLNTGCVPSKAFIRSAKINNYLKRSQEFGLGSASHQMNFSQVMERVQKVIKKVEPHDSIERYTKLGVECIQGEAKIVSPYEVKVGERTLTTKNIVVATGASPLVPPIPRPNNFPILTSNNIWNLKELPAKLVILGGGPIGCELAQSFARLGSEVYLVEMAPRLMIREDVEVSQLMAKTFEKEGVKLFLSHKALRIEEKESNKFLYCENDGKEVAIVFDQILFALGRKANINHFGLEELGIEISSRGTVVADEFLRTTNYPNIFVCGDVTGPYQFTHTASHQAWYVAVNALFGLFKKFKVDYKVIPWCTFTDPEVARVGLNEDEARQNKIDYQVFTYQLGDLDRAIAEDEDHGFVKVLIAPGTDKILGVTIVGAHAGDIIAEYVTAIKFNLGLNKILSTIHIYPTFAEANKYAAGIWKRETTNKKIFKFLERYHRWMRS